MPESVRFAVLCLFAALPAYAGGQPEGSLLDRSTAAQIVAEVDLALAMAQQGQYGRIRPRDLDRLQESATEIFDLLDSVSAPAELPAAQRKQLALAYADFTEILRPEDEERRICRRIEVTGTRLGGVECMTLGERKARARAAGGLVEDAQRGTCIPGEASACGVSGRPGG